MSIPKRIWRLFRSEVNHRLGRFDTPEHKAFREAWERAQREAGTDDFDFGSGTTQTTTETTGLEAHYRTLGLKTGASFEDVRRAYRQLIKDNHPDKFQTPAEVEAATERMQSINAAYTALKTHLA